MRNLILLSTSQQTLPEASTTSVSAIAIDLDEDTLFVAAERQTEDGDVEVEVLKLPRYSECNIEPGVPPVRLFLCRP